MRVLVTGGAGFIGSAFIRFGLTHVAACTRIVNVDALTYAANPAALAAVEGDPRYQFIHGDINDRTLIESALEEHAIDVVLHCAAETHVDRSIAGPEAFVRTNVLGTLSLLEAVRRQPRVRFHMVSTDEVYGSLGPEGSFSERSPYRPNSPYSASKAAADHFVRAYAHTYGLETTLSHCSNNFGPYQHPEKFIPRMLAACCRKEPLPVYGSGQNVRDWLYVDDHVEALWTIIQRGTPGEVYGVGAGQERRNIDLVHELIALCADLRREDPETYRALIAFVPDRPGHDYRYAIDSSKLRAELGWRPRRPFAEALRATVEWYVS
jgi:dTDP-glucose 4,6-dehydratase